MVTLNLSNPNDIKKIRDISDIEKFKLIDYSNATNSLAIFHDNYYIRVLSEDLGTRFIPIPQYVYTMKFSNSGTHIALIQYDGTAYIIDLNNSPGNESAFIVEVNEEDAITGLEFSSDDRVLISSTKNGEINFYSFPDFSQHVKIDYRQPITSIKYVENDRLLVGTSHGSVSLHDIQKEVFDVTAINDESTTEQNPRIFPNPFSKNISFTIDSKNYELFEISLFDIFGTTVARKS